MRCTWQVRLPNSQSSGHMPNIQAQELVGFSCSAGWPLSSCGPPTATLLDWHARVPALQAFLCLHCEPGCQALLCITTWDA